MDLQEWDLLPDEGFVDQENDFSPKSIPTIPTLIDMNYFQKFSEPKKNSGVTIPVPIQFHNQDENFEEIPEEVTKFPIETTTITTTKLVSDDQLIKEADHQETVSQVSFKKLMENEFVDMKVDSPKSLNRGLVPQIDVSTYQFEEKLKDDKEEEKQIPINEKEQNSKIEEVSGKWGDQKNDQGLNVWKWAMTGIGALCSFGFAAATVSLIVLGNRHRENCNNSKKQAELHFQIYSHDKRFKQVVRHATKLNDALTAMRGAPVARAHITIGGYHESV